jgi:DNA replication protein DnaC
MICLAGIFGCGKTDILRGAFRYVNAIYMQVYPDKWPHPISTSFVRWAPFVREVANDNREHFDDVVKSDVIFVDDIGAEDDEFKSGKPTRILGDFLDSTENKYVFITTNIAPDGWRARWDGRIEDRLLRRNSVLVNGYDPELRCISYAQYLLEKK